MKVRYYIKCIIITLITFSFLNVQGQSLAEELEAQADIIVDINGSGDYTTVREGLSAIPDSSETPTVVYVKKGFYYEKLILRPEKWNVILVGEDVDSTIISFDDHADAVLPGHTFSSYTFRADAHDFQAYNITFEATNQTSQAVAYHSNGDRQILFHCRLVGNQDTYFDNFRTRRYMKDVYIEGDVDFIFGFGVTLFDSCHIYCNDAGYISAASTPEHYEFGYVFKHCVVTTRDGGFWSTSLGRPWFPFSNTIFFESWLTDRIVKKGWSPWSGREATCIYREYNSRGPGARPEDRAEWASQLDPALAPRYNMDTIFAASNFPSDLGPEVDSIEFWSMRNRFEDSGYADRADTILFAGRDSWPSYPTDDWHPEFYEPIYSIVNKYTDHFTSTVDTGQGTSGIIDLSEFTDDIRINNPVDNKLIINSNQSFNDPGLLTLYDVNGRKVFEKHLPYLNNGITEIDIQHLSNLKGVILFQLESKTYRTVGKLFKN